MRLSLGKICTVNHLLRSACDVEAFPSGHDCEPTLPDISVAAIAEPGYVGARYANPEAETFGSRVTSAPRTPIAFVESPQIVGDMTGDPEKDTIAFQPIAVFQNQPAFGSYGARNLQGAAPVLVALTQPAFGSKGARDLQGFVLVLSQPADGARGARELQVPPNASVAQFAN